MLDATKIRPVWQDATIIEHRQEAIDVAAIVFQLDSPITFLPGQYANIRLRFPDRDRPVQRSYSIASPPNVSSDRLELIVAKVPGGLVSTEVVDHLTVGQSIELRGPYGKFTWTEANPSPVLMIAAGSGVVPFLSMMEYMSQRQLQVPATLLVSSRSASHAIGHRAFARLDPSLTNLRVVTSYTRDPDDTSATYHRRIDAPMLDECGARNAEAIYICGPDEMVRTTRELLESLGVDESLIQTEIY